MWDCELGLCELTFRWNRLIFVLKLTATLIYPVDVAKTVYQKALLSAGSSHVPRPPIRVLHAGAYKGEMDGTLLTVSRLT